MRPLFLLPALLALGACQTSTVPFEPVSDACGSLKYLSTVGTKWTEVPPGTFPPEARVIHPDTAVTRDFRPDRLNVHINNKGRIERVDCG